jgi:hypothetical protein
MALVEIPTSRLIELRKSEGIFAQRISTCLYSIREYPGPEGKNC